MVLVYALVKAPTLGWTDGTDASVFRFERGRSSGLRYITSSRVKNPLMPLKIFRIRNLSVANALMFFMTAGMFSDLFLYDVIFAAGPRLQPGQDWF